MTNRFYIKTRRAVATQPGEYALHIHIDAQETIPEEAIEALLTAGFTYDLFDPVWRIYGKDGDPTKPFDHHEPAQHMTFPTSNLAKFEEKWVEAVAIIEQSQARCYIEGELIVIDQPLTCQPFDVVAFNLVVSLVETVGGVAEGSLKIELAIRFAVLNGVDYNSAVPPVLQSVEFRSDFAHLDADHLGSLPVNLAELTREMRRRTNTLPHVDKAEQFRRIWERTLAKG